MNLSNYKYIIIGSGFFGSVLAERIANDCNEKVLIIEKRNHIGGNCYSEIDKETGIEEHKYGSHIFHTDDLNIWNYISNFMKLNHYHHKVLTKFKDKVYQMPINLNTINNFFNINLKPDEVEDFIKKEIKKEKIGNPKNLEEKAISYVGRRLYEAFIKGYTQKQWGTDPKKLPSDIIARLHFRYNYDIGYFIDPYQGIPKDGYTKIFEKLLNHPNINILLNIDYFDVKDKISNNSIIVFTGAIDGFFNYKFGHLGWRTINFEKEIIMLKDFQGTSVINYVDVEIPYTRIHEFKHYHPERNCFNINKTVIYKEYSRFAKIEDEPYYPINTKEDKEKLSLYQKDSKKLKNVFFGGRLGNYKYYDMDDTIIEALKFYNNVIRRNK